MDLDCNAPSLTLFRLIIYLSVRKKVTTLRNLYPLLFAQPLLPDYFFPSSKLPNRVNYFTNGNRV